jgi:hypothetical protein
VESGVEFLPVGTAQVTVEAVSDLVGRPVIRGNSVGSLAGEKSTPAFSRSHGGSSVECFTNGMVYHK